MNAIARISQVLYDKYGFYVSLAEIGYESLEFYKEEIDEQLVPVSVLEQLEDPIQTETASYTDVVGHNHPSNDVTPSPEDIDVTERLVEAGKIIGIDVMDHIVLESDKFLPMKEKGYI